MPTSAGRPGGDRGWLARVAPGVVRRAIGRRAARDLWVRCAETGELCYRPDLEAALWVTPGGHHMRIGAEQRFAITFDGGVCERLPSPVMPDDPLSFTYAKPYKPALAKARKATGERDSMAAAVGRIEAAPAVVLAQDFAFMGGSLGMAAGETFVTAAEAALSRHAALVIFTAAAGARMQESALAQPALRGGAHRPHHRRRHRLLRDARRRAVGRAGRGDRLHRTAGDLRHHPRNFARHLPNGGFPGRTRHGRSGGSEKGAAEGDRPDPAHPHGGEPPFRSLT